MTVDILSIINSLPTSLPPDPKRQWKIDHLGKIHKHDFHIILWLFTAIAFLLSICRFALRLHLRRRLFFDDALMLFSLLSLIGATVLLYVQLNGLYDAQAFIIAYPAIKQSRQTLLYNLTRWRVLYDVFLVLSWSAIFSVKFSFLAFFRQLLGGVSRWLERWYWFVVGLTVVSWAVMMGKPFVVCPRPASLDMRCYPKIGSPRYEMQLGLTSLGTILDVATDLMLLSIPIIILRMSGLRPSQKLGLATFLCLSIAMVACSLTRNFGAQKKTGHGKPDFDTIWQVLWLQIEACVAVSMGSLTAFRALFATKDHRKAALTEKARSSSTLLQRIRSWFGASNKSQDQLSLPTISQDSQYSDAPKVPEQVITRSSMTGLRRYMRRFQRPPGETTVENGVSSVAWSVDSRPELIGLRDNGD